MASFTGDAFLTVSAVYDSALSRLTSPEIPPPNTQRTANRSVNPRKPRPNLRNLMYSRGLSQPLAEKSPRPGHSRVTAGSQQSIKTHGDCLHLKDTKYQHNITYTREPTPRTADYSSGSTTLHYKQAFCQNGLI